MFTGMICYSVVFFTLFIVKSSIFLEGKGKMETFTGKNNNMYVFPPIPIDRGRGEHSLE